MTRLAVACVGPLVLSRNPQFRREGGLSRHGASAHDEFGCWSLLITVLPRGKRRTAQFEYAGDRDRSPHHPGGTAADDSPDHPATTPEVAYRGLAGVGYFLHGCRSPEQTRRHPCGTDGFASARWLIWLHWLGPTAVGCWKAESSARVQGLQALQRLAGLGERPLTAEDIGSHHASMPSAARRTSAWGGFAHSRGSRFGHGPGTPL